VTETYGAKALRIALTQVGTKEDPPDSNTGPKVREYQSATDLGGTGWPWCAGFFHWAYTHAGAVQPYRSASVPKLLGWYTHRQRVVQPDQVRPGDAVIYDWQRDGTPDHIGLFRRWMTPAHTDFEAVEGNTAVGNNSNGGEVMVRLRYVKDVAAFVRPVGSRVPVGTKFDPVTGEAHRSVAARVWRLVRRRNGLVYVEPTD
jgi:hypothetical protein